MNIYGKKVVLRAMELSDCVLIQDMFNDPEMENLVVGWAFPVSAYAQEQWIRRITETERISGLLSKRRRMVQWGLPH